MKLTHARTRKLATVLAALVLTSVAVRPVTATELIVNGDFSLGNVGFTSGYLYSPGNIQPPLTYDITTNPNNSHPLAASYGDHTTGTGLMMAVNGTDSISLPVWTQTVAVIPNTDYPFSAWVSTWFPAVFAQLDFVFNGSSIGMFTAPSTAGVWQEFSTTWNSGASTTVTISIFDRTIAFGGNDFALDDISLQGSVPEPGGLVLLGIGTAGLIGYRWLRRRRRP